MSLKSEKAADIAEILAEIGDQLQGTALRGYFVKKSQTSIENNRWVAELEIVAGVDTSA